MSKPLSQLIYCSRQNIGAARLDFELEAIIKTSVRNNRSNGVTGLLLAHQGWFVQVLEGPSDMVQTTYGRIINDGRHVGRQVLSVKLISERQFGEWAMCARRLTTADDAILGVLDAREGFDPTRFDAKTSSRLLLAVRNIRDRLRSNSQTTASPPVQAAGEL